MSTNIFHKWLNLNSNVDMIFVISRGINGTQIFLAVNKFVQIALYNGGV
jgi:hypothetical protein